MQDLRPLLYGLFNLYLESICCLIVPYPIHLAIDLLPIVLLRNVHVMSLWRPSATCIDCCSCSPVYWTVKENALFCACTSKRIV